MNLAGVVSFLAGWAVAASTAVNTAGVTAVVASRAGGARRAGANRGGGTGGEP